MQDPNDGLLNVRETAKRLGVHENTVRNWAREGRLQDARIPGSRYYRFRADEVDRLASRRGEPVDTLQSSRLVVNPELVDADQLDQWPDTRQRDAQGHFPELIHRLLAETPGVSILAAPFGDGIAAPGFDAIARAKAPTTYLPAGNLVFEFGVGKDLKKKATADYDKRLAAATPGTTFVFATPRKWERGEKWAAERRGDGKFRDVRVLTASQLTVWLQQAPSTHSWLSEHLGLRPRQITTLDTWWTRFSGSTNPPLPSQLFLAGRASQAETLRKLINEHDARRIVIRCNWRADGLAFVKSALDDRAVDSVALSAPLIIDKAEVWNRVIEKPSAAALIPSFDDPDIRSALGSGHHVILIDDLDVGSNDGDIVLGRLNRREAAEAFTSDHSDLSKADGLAVRARRSLPALVRELSVDTRKRTPDWLAAGAADVLSPLALVGHWRDQAGDREAVADLVGRPWEDIEAAAVAATGGADPLLRRTGEEWMIVAPEEAWTLLRARLAGAVLTRWQTVVEAVLLEADPFDGLTDGQRLQAQLKGVSSRYSGALKRGLAQSLALMGALECPAGPDAERARRVVRSLLRAAVDDAGGTRWRALSALLPDLAEAAPDEFLDQLEDDLTSGQPTLAALFGGSDEPFPLGPSPDYTGLLWALERVGWESDFLARSARILGRLAGFETRRQWANTPLASLETLLCGRVRHTAADVKTRLDALDAVHQVDEETAWKLGIRLLPQHHAVSSPPNRPRFRITEFPNHDIPMTEWLTFTGELVGRLIEWSAANSDRTIELIDHLDALPGRQRTQVLDHVGQRASGFDGSQRLALFQKVRGQIARHERHSASAWAMPEEPLDQLRELRDRIEPDDDPRRNTYLFSWHPDLDGQGALDPHEYLDELRARRAAALDEVLGRQDAFTVLADFARRSEARGELGSLLGLRDTPIKPALVWLASDESALEETARPWLWSWMISIGPEALDRLLAQTSGNPELREKVLDCIPGTPTNWEVLARYPDAADTYWSDARISLSADSDHWEVVNGLTDRGRPWVALSLIQQLTHADHAEITDANLGLIRRVVKEALATEPGPGDYSQMSSYDLGQALDILDASGLDDDELIPLEFVSYQLLEHDREPVAMFRRLAATPELFVELASLAFTSERERGRNRDADQERAMLAYTVIQGWHGFPGQREDGTLDAALMKEWVVDARRLFSEVDRSDIGDELIGEQLANTLEGDDGLWPPTEVAELIEVIGSRRLETGIHIGRINGRGVTVRSPDAGGKSEREFAARYRTWSTAAQVTSPRTSRLLRSLAESYERDANREDLQADLNQDRR